MSFFGSLLGDFDDDPFTGHMRQMNRMMNSLFNVSPFGGLMGGGSTDLMPFDNRRGGGMMPFGFPDMERMFQGVGVDQGRGNCHAFTSSTVMTMTNGPDGRPQVYQASQSVRSGPGGVRETKKTVADSRSGVKKMAIGHHIGERSHIMEREQNMHSGDQEEREEFINLDEEEAGEFNREWEQKTRSYSARTNAITYPTSSRYGSARRHHENTPMLPPAPSQSSYRSRARLPSHRRSNYVNYPALPPPTSSSSYNEVVEEDDDDDDDDEDEDGNNDNDTDEEEGGVSIVELDDDDDEDETGNEVKLPNTQQKIDKEKERSRKREHEPDVLYKSKVLKLHRDSNVQK
ncbi:myeloid leukemia factor 2-like isoform X2 [Lycorma delicatula]|uniref:myeloid leukemia factor 2-like isoform X2 n=1 Tax=Lycorma delicatula TaxID=130591 RepID=UPI003F514569